jgi:tetratricopeptide (TPR) repeat protein
MYYPLWEPEEPRHKRVNQKLIETITKLKKNRKQIEDIIGEVINRLVLVIPEDPDSKIRQYQQQAKKDSKIIIEIWGETEISSLVNRHYQAIKDYLPFDFDRPSSVKKSKKSERIPTDIRKVLDDGIKLRNVGNYEQARKLFQESLELATDRKHRIGEAEAKRWLGVIVFEKDRNETEAVSLLEESLRIFKEHGSPHWEALSLFQLGVIKTDQGKLDEAWAYVSRSLEIDKKNKKLYGVAWDLHQLGWIEDHRGNLKESLQLYDQALTKFLVAYQDKTNKNDAEMLHAIGGCYHHKGITYEKQGQLEEAESSFNQALVWEGRAGFKPDLMKAYFLLARLQYRKNKYDPATKNLDEATKIAKEVSDSYFVARCLELKARYYYTIGSKDKASSTFEEALNSLSNDDQERIKYLNQIGLFLLETNNHELAKSRFIEALELPPSEKLFEERITATVRLARIAEIENDNQERERLLHQGITLLDQILILPSPKPRRAYAFGWAGALYEELGNLQAALSCYEKAKKEYEELHDTWGIAKALTSVGHICGQLGRGKEELESYREVKRLVAGTGFYDIIAGTAINLGNIYLDLGNLSEAKNMLREAILLSSKYNLHYDKNLKTLSERYQQEIEIRKPPELEFKELVTELFELIDWFPEAKDNIFRLWMWGRQEALLGNYRSLDGIKFVIYQDDTDQFLKLAEFFAPLSDLCLQVVSSEYPGVGFDIVPFPPHKKFFFDCALPVKEEIDENQYAIRFVQGGINSRYTLVGDKAVSKQTGNEAAIITGWSIGLPEQAHRLILSRSANEIINGKIFFLPYERHLSKDPFPNDLGFTKHFGMIPVYFDSLPSSEDVEVIRRKHVEVPYMRDIDSALSQKLIKKLKAALYPFASIQKKSIKSSLDRLENTIGQTNVRAKPAEKTRLDFYVLEFNSVLQREIHVAVVVKDRLN